jgi:hypothetical protein
MSVKLWGMFRRFAEAERELSAPRRGMFRHCAEPKRGHSARALRGSAPDAIFGSDFCFLTQLGAGGSLAPGTALSPSPLTPLSVPTLLRKSSAFQGTQTLVNMAGKPSFSYLLPSARLFAQNMKSITRNCSAIILI